MWKCGTRRFRDTVERGANHYDKCSSAGINNSSWCEFFTQSEKKKKNNDSPCCWFITQKCWNSFNKENDTKHKRWNFEHLNRTWIGAIAWSSALVFGWYTSHLIHFNFKKNRKDKPKFCIPKVHNLLESLSSTCNSQKKLLNLDLNYQIEKFLGNPQVVHAISYDHNGGSSDASHSSSGVWTNSSEPVDSDLGDVLNSIENRLGLAEIESGHYNNGLHLLRSAANRSHAPAIYNLGLCYEMGLGVAVDEKIAMGFYRTAASLHHPGALYNLGIYYGQGRGGLPRDHVTAMRLLKLAAVQGQEDAITAIRAMEPATDKLVDDTNNDSTAHDICDKSKDAPTFSSLLQQLNYEPIVF